MPGEDMTLRDILGYEVWAEYFLIEVDCTSLAAGTGSAFTDFSTRIDSDAPFAMQSRSFTATNSDIYIQIQDTSRGRFLTNGKRHIRTLAGQPVAGSGVGFTTAESLFSPMPLMTPYIFDPATVITVSAADNHNSGTNNLYLALHGAKIRRGKAPWDRQWSNRYQFSYGMTGTTVAVPANGTAVGVIQIGQDAHFLVRSISGTRTNNALTVRTVDGAHDKNWSSVPIFIDNFMGNGASPNIIPSPRLLERGTSVSFYFVDTSGSTNTVEITLHGEKLIE